MVLKYVFLLYIKLVANILQLIDILLSAEISFIVQKSKNIFISLFSLKVT